MRFRGPDFPALSFRGTHPHADPYARGVFFGLSYVHGQDHFVRAILEGVAFSQLDCLSLMNEVGVNTDKVDAFWRRSKKQIMEADHS